MVATYPLIVRKKIIETEDSVSLLFSVASEHQQTFVYIPAQFLTLYFNIHGISYRRSYSISSSPLVDTYLQTTVKRVQGGVVSNYIVDHLKEGSEILSRKPAGKFFKPPADLKPKHYYLFAGGSGITPIFSIIKTALLSDSKNEVTLFYANKDESSIIYYNELEKWRKRYPNFRIWHILSRPKENWCSIRERLSQKVLETYLKFSSKNILSNLFYLCGPSGLMDTVESFLTQKGVHKKQIHTESFFTAKRSLKQAQVLDLKKEEDSSGIVIRGKLGEGDKSSDNTCWIKANIGGEVIEIKARSDLPIVEQLLAEGHNPPFSCLSGSCMSCLAVLKKGQIKQEERGILEDSNIQRHEMLTCQAKPESQVVEVDYDI